MTVAEWVLTPAELSEWLSTISALAMIATKEFCPRASEDTSSDKVRYKPFQNVGRNVGWLPQPFNFAINTNDLGHTSGGDAF